MTESSLIPRRPEIDLDEAIEFAKCTAKDLFYQAEIGRLVIYAVAYDWEVGSIRGINNSKLATIDQAKNPTLDTTFGEHTLYDRESTFKFLYQSKERGNLPISANTFRDYRLNPDGAMVSINLNLHLNLPYDGVDRFLWPKNEVLLKDLIVNNRLVISLDGLTALRGELPQKSLNEMSEHELWPEELSVAIQAWLHASNEFAKNPAHGKSPKQLIKDWIIDSKFNGSNGRPISIEMAEQIGTIANWQKGGGAPTKPKD